MELNINSLADFVSQADILWAKGFMSVPQVARNSGLFKEVAIPNLRETPEHFLKSISKSMHQRSLKETSLHELRCSKDIQRQVLCTESQRISESRMKCVRMESLKI